MAPAKGTRVLDEELKGINEKVQELGQAVRQTYLDMRNILETNDKEMALALVRNDETINEMEEEINEETIRIIALQAPVATDLRVLISALKIAGQLERIADYSVNVADYVLLVRDTTSMPTTPAINIMLSFIVEMLELVMQAYSEQNLKLAKEVAAMDNKLDEMYGEALELILKKANTEELTEYDLKTTLIIKYLERAGDHITNVAESIAYLVKGRSYDLNKGIAKRKTYKI